MFWETEEAVSNSSLILPSKDGVVQTNFRQLFLFMITAGQEGPIQDVDPLNGIGF